MLLSDRQIALRHPFVLLQIFSIIHLDPTENIVGVYKNGKSPKKFKNFDKQGKSPNSKSLGFQTTIVSMVFTGTTDLFS